MDAPGDKERPDEEREDLPESPATDDTLTGLPALDEWYRRSESRLLPTPWAHQSGFKRAIHSTSFYVAWFGMATAASWGVVASANKAYPIYPAVAITMFSVLVVSLRLIRGSVTDSKRALYRELLPMEYSSRAHDEKGNPYSPVDSQLGVEPSDRLRERLFPGELVLWETHQHPISVVASAFERTFRTKTRRVATAAYLAVVGITLTTDLGIGLLALIPGLLVVLLRVVEWRRDIYALTDQRIMAVTGLVETRVPFMPRNRVTDVVVRASAVANILAWLRLIRLPYGQFNIESAGQDQALKIIDWLPGADVVAAVLSLGKIPG